MAYLPDALNQVATQLKNGEKPPGVAVRTLLSWFDYQRRSLWNVYVVRGALAELGITTEPDFELVYIDAPVQFALRPSEESNAASSGVDGNGTSKDQSSDNMVWTIESPDPTYRVGMLPSANQIPTSVKPSATLEEATTLMLANDFSQLPVMVNERDLKGVISWTAIGSRLALGRPLGTVADFMDPAIEITYDTPLLTAIGTIVRNDYVLIRHGDNRIAGIVTSADLSVKFQELAEPFLLLGEIENHIRWLIQGKISVGELREVRDQKDEREIAGVADLTLGEYQRLLENPETWSKLQLELDRAAFVKKLDNVRRIRNDVMHFDPDPIGNDDMTELRNFARMMQVLRQTKAI